MTTRLDVNFTSGSDQCAAWLYLPSNNEPAPVLVMAHGLGGTRGMRLDAFAERYSAAGYACLVFDYRHFGDSEGEPRQLLNIERELEDYAAAVKFIKNDVRVDGSQVVIWGSSFSGGHAIKLGATLPGIAGIMSQCPFTDGLSSSLALHPLSSIKVGTLAIADILSNPFRKTPIMVNLAGNSGDAALMSAHDAKTGYGNLQPDNGQLPYYVAARFGLSIMGYFPGRFASKVSCPALVIACLKDTVAPVKPTLKYAAQLPAGEVVQLDCGHFDIYIGDWFEQTVAVQLTWLTKYFPLS
ncbi:MAG: alpha/beta hydrolase [Oleibacter sp.]|nr:alpha/beta hydrolase [Thalassolituus sp.]